MKKSQRRKQVRASYFYLAPFSLETDEARRMARDLQDQGVRAATSHSVYVGHRALAVHPEDVGLAVKALRQMGEAYIADSFRRAAKGEG